MQKKFTVTNIKYDTDGAKVSLPKKLVIIIPDNVEDNPDDIEQYISDEISNRTGYCHEGFALTPKLEY